MAVFQPDRYNASSVMPDDGCITLSSDNENEISYLPPTDSRSRRKRQSGDDDRWEGNPDVFQTARRVFSRESSLIPKEERSNWHRDYGRRSLSRTHSSERKRRNTSTISSTPERRKGMGDITNRYNSSRERRDKQRRSRTYSRERKSNNSRSSTRSKRWSEAHSSRGTGNDKDEYWRGSYSRSESRERRKRRRGDSECNSSRTSVSRDEGFQLERNAEVNVKLEGKLLSCSTGDIGKIYLQRKGEKKTFYCDLCMIELNSEDTRNSHVNGAKHSKMLQDYTDKMRKYAARGQILPEKLVYQIANPEAVRKKTPIRLHEKIKQSADPVVGLDYIKEFIAFSDPEMEPFYDCELCGSHGHANMIFGHIMGSKHRQNFAEIIFKNEIINGQKRYKHMKREELIQFAREYSENGSKLSRKIRSKTSDKVYPWPPGKAPWSIEKGGNGVAPDGARKYSESTLMESKIVILPAHRKIQSKNYIKLPPPWELKAPQNLEEVFKYLDLGSRMIGMATDFSNVEEPTKTKLKHVLDRMTNEMKKETSEHL